MNFKGNQRFCEVKGRSTLLTFEGFSEVIYLLLLFETNYVSALMYPCTPCDLFDDEDLYNEKGDDFHSIPQWLQNGVREMKLSIRTRNVKVFSEKKSNCTPPFTLGQLPSLSLLHSFNFHFSISLSIDSPFPQTPPIFVLTSRLSLSSLQTAFACQSECRGNWVWKAENWPNNIGWHLSSNPPDKTLVKLQDLKNTDKISFRFYLCRWRNKLSWNIPDNKKYTPVCYVIVLFVFVKRVHLLF